MMGMGELGPGEGADNLGKRRGWVPKKTGPKDKEAWALSPGGGGEG